MSPIGHASRPTVVLAEPHALVRDIVKAVCVVHDLDVIGEASSGAQLVSICEQRRPDLAVVGIDFADGPVEGYLDRLLRGDSIIVILARDVSSARVATLLERGARAHLHYDSSPDEVARTLLEVAASVPTIDLRDAAVPGACDGVSQDAGAV